MIRQAPRNCFILKNQILCMMDPEQKPCISELKITIISTLSEVKKRRKESQALLKIVCDI
jgi:hypothetical protein